MAGFVISGITTLFFRHDHAFTLWPHQNFVFCFFEILHFHCTRAAAGGHQRSFIAKVGEVGARHTRRAAGNHAGANVLTQWHLAHVDVQNLLTATNIWQRDVHLTVKTARA